ncbi:MAG TPA: amidohydrolase family protein, partial [Candidatus Binatia bacterium]
MVPRTSGRGLSLFGTPATSRHARAKPFSIGSQELTDLEARIRDLDKFGIDTQIINSTLLNATLSPDIEFKYALCRAYNTWVHEICEQSSGRLRWNAMLRLTHIEKALEELRRIEALGAAAAEIHGMAGDKLLDSREFDPFWSEAERLNTPIYVHIGFESPIDVSALAFTGQAESRGSLLDKDRFARPQVNACG